MSVEFVMRTEERMSGRVRVKCRFPVFSGQEAFAVACNAHLERARARFAAQFAQSGVTATQAGMLTAVCYASQTVVSLLTDLTLYEGRRILQYRRMGEIWLLPDGVLLPPPRSAREDGWYSDGNAIYLLKTAFDPRSEEHQRRPQRAVTARLYARGKAVQAQ